MASAAASHVEDLEMRIAPWLLVALGTGVASAASIEPLEMETKISLGDIRGRIDHLAIDLNRQRLYVAELGNATVGVIDLKARRTVQTLTGFKEPQGIGYEPVTDTVYVANGADGTVGVYQGADMAPLGKLTLGEDADNVRIDSVNHHVLVGHGSGALAVIDPVDRKLLVDIALKGHPESFQIAQDGQHIVVNIPDNGEIAVIDSVHNRQQASWKPPGLLSNFPLAINEARQQAIVAFRGPPRLGVFDLKSGTLLSTVDTCGDSDDLFLDTQRGRLYISCGDGHLDVFRAQDNGYVRIARIGTVSGARTCLWVPAIDRLLLAVRATGSVAATIWVYRPIS
jgi:DNA-binding beta-propeller fold protein YncE